MRMRGRGVGKWRRDVGKWGTDVGKRGRGFRYEGIRGRGECRHEVPPRLSLHRSVGMRDRGEVIKYRGVGILGRVVRMTELNLTHQLARTLYTGVYI